MQGWLCRKVTAWTEAGGCFLTSYFSGYTEDHDLVITGGYPGRLRKLLGIWVEEADALAPEQTVRFSYGDVAYPASILCDLLHLEGAESLGCYQDEFYAGMPSVTRNRIGNGCAYYVATHSEPGFYDAFLSDVCQEQGISPIADTPADVEVTLRVSDTCSNYFVLNHNSEPASFCLPAAVRDLISGEVIPAGVSIPIQAKDVRILQIVASR